MNELVPTPPVDDLLDAQLRKFQKELSAGTVSLALLGVLGSAGEPMYGYQIAKTLERHGEGVLSGKQSALYPVLRNLEAAGLLESYVEPSVSGPPRRYYVITPLGRSVLRAWSSAWRATRASVDAVLGAAAAPTGDAAQPEPDPRPSTRADPSNADPSQTDPSQTDPTHSGSSRAGSDPTDSQPVEGRDP